MGIAFPLATVTGLNRAISDHVPSMLSNGCPPVHCNLFRYENCWVEREGFLEIVQQSWNGSTHCRFDLDEWQEKGRRLRRHFKGWHINIEGIYRNKKKLLLSKLEILDKKAEVSSLSINEREE